MKQKESPKASPSQDIKLSKVPASITGIEFNNRIQENERLHCFIWNFIYQGAGVGIADINNDGLQDIYFCGNMVSDKLYLNKGNFEFEDISRSSGIQDKLWSTGVNFVDVNSDGLLDIYVCKNFFLLQEGVRKNKLFINNGDLSFTEKAEEYGIADAGFSIQSYFFDADNDHDLDMYLVNQPMDQYAARYANPENLAKLPHSDKFYEFDNGKYIDRTKDLGLDNSSYGLSAVISDINNDGWKDIYICNDYQQGDKLLINQGGLKFTEEIKDRLDHSSFYSMGSDVDDINNDGLSDIISLDMAFKDHFRSKTNMESMRPDLFKRLVEEGNHYQYPVNNLQLNRLDGYFSEIGQYAGVSHTDWSWSSLFTDLDLDGYSDLLISNGILRDLRNNDFIQGLRNDAQQSPSTQNYQELINRIPSTPVGNVVFRNTGKLKFEDQSQGSGFEEKNFSSGMAIADLDNDGDMDVVVNNTNSLAGIYKNETGKNKTYIKLKINGPKRNPNGLSYSVILYQKDEKHIKTINSARGYMSSSQAEVVFGLKDCNSADSIKLIWDHEYYSMILNPECNQTHTISYSDRQRLPHSFEKTPDQILEESFLIDFTHHENAFDEYREQVLLPHMISTSGPRINLSDLNNDGLTDILIASSAGSENRLYLQNSAGKFIQSEEEEFIKNKARENLGSALLDHDSDGDMDLYLCSGGSQFNESTKTNKDILFLNNGKGTFESSLELTDSNIDGSCVLAHDFNGDGVTDIFIGGRSYPGRYGIKPDSRILIAKDGSYTDASDTLCPDLRGIGMVTDACLADIDKDMDMDIIIVGEWMSPTLLRNEDNKYVKSSLIEESQLSGWWWSIASGDFDNDGDMDLLIGNIGENNKFKPTADNSLKLYAGDIDGNGDHDVILAKSSENILLPVRGKECSTEEIPYISEKFPSYSEFARASLVDIYDSGKLESASSSEVNSFSHYYLENDGSGKYTSHKLPYTCQTGPIKDFVLTDINKDGNLDFLYGGNHYDSEAETVRYDSGSIGICLGDGQGKFRDLSSSEIGILIKGDIRDLELIKIKGEDHLLVGSNNSKLRSFLIRKEHIPD